VVETVKPSAGVVAKRITKEVYQLRYADYAEKLVAAGMKDSKDAVRKLKGWVKIGREAVGEPDLPPFDELGQLAAWWRRNMTYKVPEYLLHLEAGVLNGETAAPAGGTEDGKGGSVPGRKDEPVVAYEEIELDAEVAQELGVKVAHALAQSSLRRFNEAQRRGEWGVARQIRGELLKDLDVLRKEQISALKVLEGRGEYLRVETLREELNRMLAILDISFFNCLEDVIQAAAPQIAAELRRERALEARDKVFEHLHQTKFATAYVPHVP
jgi:hypothetical protein